MAIEKQKSGSSKNIQNMIAILLFALTIIAVTFFVFPVKDQFDQNQIQQIQKQSELTAQKNRLSRLSDLESRFEGGEVTRNDILNLIPQNVEQHNVIETLADISEENDVILNSLSFGLTESRELGVNILTITTNVSGSHGNLNSFLKELETDSRKFVVKTISVQVLENRIENMTLSIEAYYL